MEGVFVKAPKMAGAAYEYQKCVSCSHLDLRRKIHELDDGSTEVRVSTRAGKVAHLTIRAKSLKSVPPAFLKAADLLFRPSAANSVSPNRSPARKMSPSQRARLGIFLSKPAGTALNRCTKLLPELQLGWFDLDRANEKKRRINRADQINPASRLHRELEATFNARGVTGLAEPMVAEPMVTEPMVTELPLKKIQLGARATANVPKGRIVGFYNTNATVTLDGEEESDSNEDSDSNEESWNQLDSQIAQELYDEDGDVQKLIYDVFPLGNVMTLVNDYDPAGNFLALENPLEVAELKEKCPARAEEPNCEFRPFVRSSPVEGRSLHIALVATKPVPKGAEFLTIYGAQYWLNFLENSRRDHSRGDSSDSSPEKPMTVVEPTTVVVEPDIRQEVAPMIKSLIAEIARIGEATDAAIGLMRLVLKLDQDYMQQ